MIYDLRLASFEIKIATASTKILKVIESCTTYDQLDMTIAWFIKVFDNLNIELKNKKLKYKDWRYIHGVIYKEYHDCLSGASDKRRKMMEITSNNAIDSCISYINNTHDVSVAIESLSQLVNNYENVVEYASSNKLFELIVSVFKKL